MLNKASAPPKSNPMPFKSLPPVSTYWPSVEVCVPSIISLKDDRGDGELVLDVLDAEVVVLVIAPGDGRLRPNEASHASQVCSAGSRPSSSCRSLENRKSQPALTPVPAARLKATVK